MPLLSPLGHCPLPTRPCTSVLALSCSPWPSLSVPWSVLLEPSRQELPSHFSLEMFVEHSSIMPGTALGSGDTTCIRQKPLPSEPSFQEGSRD